MRRAGRPRGSQTPRVQNTITKVTVCGYKSISSEQSIDLGNLTILAGANSSGKSSMMQPLLLLKQTLEAPYDPGPLRLDGPSVRFTSTSQFLSHGSGRQQATRFYVAIEVGRRRLVCYFDKHPGRGLDLSEMSYADERGETVLRPGMSHEEIMQIVPAPLRDLPGIISRDEGEALEWQVVRDRCFLAFSLRGKQWQPLGLAPVSPSSVVEPHIRSIIHLPGHRGNPARTYPVTAVGPTFPGTFELYVASVIAHWERNSGKGKLEALGRDLEKLGLTWKVSVKPISDTEAELRVGRLPHCARGGARDLVSIADVGFGVSQTLLIVVALHAATKGQVVYLEQPEIHLHPRAQVAMASVLADAANRGVRVVAETHSSQVLLGVQTLVAEGTLPPESVKLHWFTRQASGETEVCSADLDRSGAFGEWPEDFGEVALTSESRYLRTAEARILAR